MAHCSLGQLERSLKYNNFLAEKLRARRVEMSTYIDTINNLIRAKQFLSKTWHKNYNLNFKITKKDRLRNKKLNNSLDEKTFTNILQEAAFAQIDERGIDRNKFLHQQEEYALAIDDSDQEERNCELLKLEEYALAIDSIDQENYNLDNLYEMILRDIKRIKE